jgi:hypothetical protein
MRDPLSGALVVVGGHSRGVGKTLVIERLLRAYADQGWIAFKVSAHRHGSADTPTAAIEEASMASGDAQTNRYLMAGARRAFLARATDSLLPRVCELVESARAEGSNVLVESNRVAGRLVADAVLFVVDPLIDDWKASSPRCLDRADAIVCERTFATASAETDMLRAITMGRPLFLTADPCERRRLIRWLGWHLATRRRAVTPRWLAS